VGIVAFDKRALNNKGGRPGPPPEEPITDVRIGPNPTATTLQLKYPTEDQKRYRLRLVNVNGQAVLSRRLANDGTDQLNMRPLEVGVYYLQLIENGAVIAERKIMRP
jgi:hypothetical protein